MPIAYLILAHAHPEQVVRTIERLRPSAGAFVIHVDARRGEGVFEALAGYAGTADDVFMADRKACYWGRYGIMEATFACIECLLAQARPFDYAVLLSGQDYPIRPAAEIAAFFDGMGQAELIEAFPLAKPNRWTAQGGSYQATARVLYWTLGFRSRTWQLKLKRRFYNGWEPHGGSQWWALTREAIEWIDGYRREHPALGRYFRFVFIPDECMIQTMVANSPFAGRISAEPVHYIDWERPNPEVPRTLDGEDFDRLRASNCLFARKMHPEMSAAVLERVDQELLG